jgi:nucleotide-binding universal stress UspA family protein
MAQKILVPIDFSEFNQKVIGKAVEHAKLVDGEIFLIHVATLDLGVIVSETGFTYLPELEETALHEEAEQLTKLQLEIIEKNVPCQVIIKQGIPADVIIEESVNINADIIVIGSLGHNTLYNMLIGSVASDVIKHSSIPLLVIPKEK